jgi:hypothetical protein
MKYKPVASDGVHKLISPPGYLNTFQLLKEREKKYLFIIFSYTTERYFAAVDR